MKDINLRKIYPEIYTEDYIMAVPDEIAENLADFHKKEEAARIKTYRYKAYLSLDIGNLIEEASILLEQSPYDIHEMNIQNEKLYSALSQLPKAQFCRIYAHYFLGLGKARIAEIEGVNKKTVRKSIKVGLRQLKDILL